MNKKLISLFAFTALLLTVSCKKQEETEPKELPSVVAKDSVIPNPTTEIQQTQTPVSNVKETELVFTEEVHDFGTIKQGDKVNHFFTFKNTGENDLIITRALGSCGCTVPEFPKEAIAPGKIEKMKVTFDSAGKSGVVEKSVTVYANIPGGVKVIKIKVNIKVS